VLKVEENDYGALIPVVRERPYHIVGRKPPPPHVYNKRYLVTVLSEAYILPLLFFFGLYVQVCSACAYATAYFGDVIGKPLQVIRVPFCSTSRRRHTRLARRRSSVRLVQHLREISTIPVMALTNLSVFFSSSTFLSCCCYMVQTMLDGAATNKKTAQTILSHIEDGDTTDSFSRYLFYSTLSEHT